MSAAHAMHAAASWRELRLDPGGRSLIEASAGTGKTWTISVLYLRLLLEQALSPGQIVVTTFTDAAAQELRERIRERLLWAERHALAAPSADTAAGDDLVWLLARWQSGGEAAARADLNRLRLALIELDRAPIGTLHSLCRRILADYPFDSGSTFGIGQPMTPDAINAELADDLWRRLAQSSAALAPDDMIWWRGGREELDAHLQKVLQPGVGVRVPAFVAVDEWLRPQNAELLERWLGDGSIFKRKTSRLFTRLSRLAQFIRAGDAAGELPQDLAEVLAEPLDRHIRGSALAAAERAPALVFARRVAGVFDGLKAQALARYRDTLRALRARRLAASGMMTFDELIERVHDALAGAHGAHLAERLAAAWPVALVDEFQDTDALQYAILDRIYRAADGARGRLVMIGDPKQAIYRFRGGDIDAYLQARATAQSTLALDVNYRASRRLVRALNALHARAGGPLSSDPAHPIAVLPVRESDCRDGEPYRIDGADCDTPLQVHYWDTGEVPVHADARVAAALDACANHVVELLAAAHTIGDRRVQPGDIAVLVPTGRHVAQLRNCLLARGVPCVATAWSSVFASDWARELQIVLYAALHLRDEAALRAALATRLGGRSFAQLLALRDQPDAWQREAATFAQAAALWDTRGVLALVQQLATAAAPRLFAGSDGERALTDLRHLGELLQARSEQVAGREELLTWLADERERAASESGDAHVDERQLRIESDAARVRLMTLHAAKGLEFDIVLLPLMWANRESGLDRIAIVHDAASGQRVVAFDGAARDRYRQEGQDERFRLLYVALTRARHACHLYALSPNRPAARARASDSDPLRAPLDALIERILHSLEPPQTMAHVRWATGPWAWPRARWQAAPAGAGAEPHVLREPPAAPFAATWSFSALLHGAAAPAVEEAAAADEADADAADALSALALDADAQIEPAPEADHPELAWLAPIAGADFGNAVHALFEHRAIGVPLPAQQGLLRRCLLDHGVGLRGIALDELVARLAARLQRVLDTPLLPGRDATLTLGALSRRALCAEMPFEFALGAVSLKRLREVCDFVPPTSLHTLRGLMTGKIDLVFEQGGRFHVVDYKSNRLGYGTRLSDYAASQLARVMADAHYRFQALLYTLAVDRYLRQRVAGYDRARHLGETLYLFVRAVGLAPDAAPDAGIWAQRFDDDLLDAVDAALAAPAGVAA